MHPRLTLLHPSTRKALGRMLAGLVAQPLWRIAALALVVMIGIEWSAHALHVASTPAITTAAMAENTSASNDDPATLSDADRGRYAIIDEAQERGDFAQADALMRTLDNRYLLGVKLAERYLDSRYAAKPAELTAWLAHYSDHPHAAGIASLAARHGLDVTLPKAAKPLRGEGYSDHLGRSSMPDGWFSALRLWREGDAASAAPLFASLSADETLGDWQRAGAYYWSYRAQEHLGDSTAARRALTHAAHYTTTFYGQLAMGHLGSRRLSAEAPEVSDAVRADPRAIRASLHVQQGDSTAAEDELRALAGALAKRERGAVVTLASELGLANLQMRLATSPGLSSAERLFANYPAPEFMLSLERVINPALVMAVARNESGFRVVAQSGAGAMGMMQMLPSTARAVERHVGEALLRTANVGQGLGPISARLNDPALSARYGAEYLKLLTQQPAIKRNLVHVLVGYNAGPGTAASWQSNAQRMQGDPLLYIESIPYGETRNYVMQVLAQYWVYQQLMGDATPSRAQLANGEWPQV